MVDLNSRPRVADAVKHVDELLTVLMFRRVTPHAVCEDGATFRAKLLALQKRINGYLAGS